MKKTIQAIKIKDAQDQIVEDGIGMIKVHADYRKHMMQKGLNLSVKCPKCNTMRRFCIEKSVEGLIKDKDITEFYIKTFCPDCDLEIELSFDYMIGETKYTA